MIRLEHVSKQYGKGKIKALDDLTLHVEKGKVFGFIGPNGAGKTTTIKLLTGILAPTEGSVIIGGQRPHGCCRRTGYGGKPAGSEATDWVCAGQP